MRQTCLNEVDSASDGYYSLRNDGRHLQQRKGDRTLTITFTRLRGAVQDKLAHRRNVELSRELQVRRLDEETEHARGSGIPVGPGCKAVELGPLHRGFLGATLPYPHERHRLVLGNQLLGHVLQTDAPQMVAPVQDLLLDRLMFKGKCFYYHRDGGREAERVTEGRRVLLVTRGWLVRRCAILFFFTGGATKTGTRHLDLDQILFFF